MKLIHALGLSTLLALVLVSPASAAQTANLLPTSEGTYLQWTPKTGSTHYTMVDETTCNGTTDYNSTTTVGNRDSYGISLSSVPDGATITQIDLTPCASRNSTGGTNPVMNVFYRLNGVDSSDSGSYSLTGTTPSVLSTTAFSGLSTVKSPSTTLESGAVLTSSTKGARLSQLVTKITYTPLSTPSALQRTISVNDVSLSWTDNASNEDGFKIERSTNGGAFVEIATVSANVTSHDDVSLADATYSYRVRAYNSGGNSGYSNTVSATIAALGVPTNLAATGSATTVNIAWIDNATGENGYSVERSDNGGTFAEVATVSANVTTYPDTSLAVGTYSYRLRAFNTGGYSNYSATASAFILAVPTSLSAVTASASVTLTWVDNASNEDGYRIERRVSGVGSFVEIKTVGPNITSTTDLNRPVGNYEYRIRAYKGAHRSDYSNTDETSVLVSPTGLSAIVSGSDVTLNWTGNSTNEEGFYIERRLVGGSYSIIDSVATDVTTYDDLGLATGNYQYRVKAFKGLDISGPTATVSATVL